MDREHKILRSTLLLGLSSMLSKGVSFFLMPLYTACLSPADFGTADVLISTAVLLMPLASLNAPEAIFRFVAGGRDRKEALGAGSLSGLLGIFVFLLILPLFRESSLFSPYLLLFFLYVIFANFHSFMAYLVRASGDYLLFAVQQLFCSLLTILLQLLFLPVLSFGIAGYLAAILSSDAVTGVWLAIWLWRRGELRISRFSRGLLLEMWRYALPLIPTAALWWVIALSDRYLILRFCGEEVLGIYAAAGKLPALLTFAVGIFLEVWRYASLRVGERERNAFFGKIYSLFLPAALALTGMLIVGNRFAVSFLFAPAFALAADLVPLLSLAAFFSALSSFLGSVYALRMTSFRSLLTALLGAVLNLILNLLLIPRYAGTGAALATLCAWILVWGLRAVDCRHSFRFSQRVGKTLLSALFCGFAVLASAADRALAAAFFVAAALCVFCREMICGLREMIKVWSKKATKQEKSRKFT